MIKSLQTIYQSHKPQWIISSPGQQEVAIKRGLLATCWINIRNWAIGDVMWCGADDHAADSASLETRNQKTPDPLSRTVVKLPFNPFNDPRHTHTYTHTHTDTSHHHDRLPPPLPPPSPPSTLGKPSLLTTPSISNLTRKPCAWCQAGPPSASDDPRCNPQRRGTQCLRHLTI